MSGSAGTFPALVNDIVESLAECQQNLARIGEKINGVQASSKCNYKTTSEGLFISARLVGRSHQARQKPARFHMADFIQ